MGWLRRAIGVIFAMAIASAAGLVFLPVAALIDPVTRAAGFALIRFVASALTEADFAGRLTGGDLVGLVLFAWTAVMAVCVVPLITVALTGEIARVRALPWYAGATGLVAASAPWLIRATLHLQRTAGSNPLELRFAFSFLPCRPDFRFGLLASRGPECGGLALMAAGRA